MSLELLKPISSSFLNDLNESYLQGSIFSKINIHTSSKALADIELFDICILGIEENRNSFFETEDQDLSLVRKELYKLKFGNWKTKILDLGNEDMLINATLIAIEAIIFSIPLAHSIILFCESP